MTFARSIPIDLHGALEAVAAPILLVAPFAFGFGPVAGAISIALGAVLLGLAVSIYGEGDRGRLPLSAHAGFDQALAWGAILAGLALGIAGEPVATIFMVGFGFAHLALSASTRYSRPLGA